MTYNFNQFAYDTLDNLFEDKINILSDLPLSCNIDDDNFEKTYKNLYKYFLKQNIIKDIPEPFFSDYVSEYAERSFFRNKFNNVLKELFIKKN